MKASLNIKMRTIIVRVLFSVLIAAAFLGLGSCNETSDQFVLEAETEEYFNVDGLIEEFGSNNSEYKESVVSVKGFVEEVNYLNNRQTVILKGTENADALIICDMQQSQIAFLENLEIGETVVVKGILKGRLNDVILLNCIISNQSIND